MGQQWKDPATQRTENRIWGLPLYACLFYLLFQLSLSAVQCCAYNSLPRRLLHSITNLSPLAGQFVESQRIFLDDLRVITFRETTRDRLQTLKTALLRYKEDTGAFPRVGSKPTPNAFAMAGEFLLGAVPRRNILFRNPRETIFPVLLQQRESAKWRGPYLDGKPEKTLLDPNGVAIRYVATSRQLLLQAAGFDGEFDAPEQCLARGYRGDDQTLIIAPLPG